MSNGKVYRQLLEVMKKRGGNYAGMDIPEFFNEEMKNLLPDLHFEKETLLKGLLLRFL